MESSVVVSQKANIDYHVIQQFHYCVYTNQNWKWGFKQQNLYISVYNNKFYNSQKGEVIQMFINWWIISKMWYINSVEHYLVMKEMKY